ncbi:hypothetical protein ABBQ32_005731 [Trebouxia sp. C0010 RCD-2024]
MLTHLLQRACQTSLPCRPRVVPQALFAACASHVYSTKATAITLQLRIPQYMVWGANTDVGKTLVSAGLAAAARRNKAVISFLKPVQTGFPEDSDARLVALTSGAAQLLGSHAARLTEGQSSHAQPGSPSHSIAKTMFAWTAPISPHAASAAEGHHVSDADLLAAVTDGLNAAADACHSQDTQGLALVETAGGPASPGPSGTLQCDCWRPLRLPAILVADARLGGISVSLSAYETLLLRGYDVPFIVMAGGRQSSVNSQAIRSNVGRDTSVVVLPGALPEAPTSRSRTELDTDLREWLLECEATFDSLLEQLFANHQQRLNLLNDAASSAKKNLWWPFTQHSTVLKDSVTVIDSRCGEQFAVYQPGKEPESSARLQMQYDACASWWTQGVSGELQAKLVRSMASAGGRYGHVIFPENTHQPALDLAEKLLSGAGQGWADRVFFSDNGSTAVEVALKMGMRKFVHDRPGIIWQGGPALHVMGLTNGYHGDTLGAMDAVAQSPYNSFDQTPWYQSHGLFLDPPTCGLSHGQWQVQLPSELQDHAGHQGQKLQITFSTREELFSNRGDMQSMYTAFIAQAMDRYESANGVGSEAPRRIASCIMEPVIQGAGGMVMIDPAFQRALAEVCQQRNIPVTLDEVFSGLWRLGRLTAAQMLGIKPDIACYAKLLTGGMLPLSATLATNSCFEAFQHDSKLKALLHGHSYTAHAVGCSTANTALEMYTDPTCNPNLQMHISSGLAQEPQLRELWESSLVDQLSRHERMQRLVVLGTVFAAELKTSGKAGYGATEAIQVTKDLRSKGVHLTS